MSTHLTVVGATGKVGALVTRAALQRGAQVSALVRDPARLPRDIAEQPGLHVVVGEIDDPTAMGRAVRDSAAAIVTVGVRYRKSHPWGGIEGRPDVAPAAIGTLLAAAPPTTHVVLLSAVGVADSWAHMPAVAKLIISTSALRVGYANLATAERLLADSGRPHTVVRAVTLTDGPGTGDSVDATGRQLRGNPKVSRADLARLLVDTALSRTGQRPGRAAGRVLVAAAR